MLTGDCYMSPDTDGSVAWLYQCPKFLSPLKIADRCYDRIPIEYGGKTHSIDPITRRTFIFANEIPCQRTYENMFQLDLDEATSWYKLSPAPEPVHLLNAPLTFEPTEIGHIIEPQEYDLQRSGLYSPAQIKDFWDNVIHNSVSATINKKLTRRILTDGKNVRSMESGKLGQAISLNNRMIECILTHSFHPTSSLSSSNQPLDLLLIIWKNMVFGLQFCFFSNL